MLDPFDQLANAYVDGRATDAEVERLSDILRADSVARDAYIRLTDIHACMAVDERLWCEPLPERTLTSFGPWLSGGNWRRPFVAAVVGLAVGLGGAGLVFAYVAPIAAKVVAILHESFESGPAPLALGVPDHPGAWSGDHSLVVGESSGVAPSRGRRMLRILTADYEGKTTPRGYTGDMHRLIDLRPYRDAIVTGQATLRVSAEVNAASFPEDERYAASVGLYAIDDHTLPSDEPHSAFMLGETSLASSRRVSGHVDRDSGTWQKLSSELRLPPETSFALLQVVIRHATNEQQATRHTFDGHYVDDIRVWLDVEPTRYRIDAPRDGFSR